MSAQTLLPSLRTGRGRYPTAYLHPGEMIELHGTNFVVLSEAVITIQYEDGEWNVLPMTAHLLGEPVPQVPAWVTEVDVVRAYIANRSRPRPRWRPLKHVTGKD